MPATRKQSDAIDKAIAAKLRERDATLPKTPRACIDLEREHAQMKALLQKVSGPLFEEAERRASGGDTPYSLEMDALADEVDTLLASLEG